MHYLLVFIGFGHPKLSPFGNLLSMINRSSGEKWSLYFLVSKQSFPPVTHQVILRDRKNKTATLNPLMTMPFTAKKCETFQMVFRRDCTFNTCSMAVFAKYYLYTQKLLKKEIKMKEFIRKLTSKLQIEKLS